MSSDQTPQFDAWSRAITDHPAKGPTLGSSTGQRDRKSRSNLPSAHRTTGMVVERGARCDWDWDIAPTAADVVDHLRTASVVLERLSTTQAWLTNGPAFPHFDEASRSIHSALIALQQCAPTQGASSRTQGDRSYPHLL